MLGKYTIMIIRQCVKTNSTPVVHIKIADKWMFIPLKMVLIGTDPYPYSLKVTYDDLWLMMVNDG